VTGPEHVTAERELGALGAIYAQIGEVTDRLTEATAMLPSRCAGWTVGDVLYHQLLDARRALVAFATPSADQPEVDAVSYWRPFAPDSGSDAALGGVGAAQHARHVRMAAAAHTPEQLAQQWRETSQAAVRAAAGCSHPAVSTQGLTLATADFISTLVVEAAVHYLDMTVALPTASQPDPAALGIARTVLEGLAGASLPGSWDDQACALKGTGRLSISAADKDELGPLASKLPLFG
jgi:uncharacterized protein (TIGR03083 family)